MINVLIIGSGGREHALAWKIKQSPLLGKLFILPGNGGTDQLGTNIKAEVKDFGSIKRTVLDNDVNMVIVGPEEPLVNGLHDYFLEDDQLSGIPMIGPVKAGAMLEGSKDFAKQFMVKYDIPTAAYRTFKADTFHEACAFLQTLTPPYVLKADGLAAGKGVVILSNYDEAVRELSDMLLDKKFGKASEQVVIEQFLKGIELSVFALLDGDSYVLLPEAKDYKRIGAGDTGPNTGGMGSVSPVSFAGKGFMKKVEDRIVKPTVEGLKKEGITYQGFLFFGLINVDGDPYVIEYNARMGDPETEVVVLRLKSDLLELLISVSNSTLKKSKVQFFDNAAACVMMVSGGYPGNYNKGETIFGLESINEGVVFHAGTQKNTEGETVTSGGRVLAISASESGLVKALNLVNKNIGFVTFKNAYYRPDIGLDMIK